MTTRWQQVPGASTCCRQIVTDSRIQGSRDHQEATSARVSRPLAPYRGCSSPFIVPIRWIARSRLSSRSARTSTRALCWTAAAPVHNRWAPSASAAPQRHHAAYASVASRPEATGEFFMSSDARSGRPGPVTQSDRPPPFVRGEADRRRCRSTTFGMPRGRPTSRVAGPAPDQRGVLWTRRWWRNPTGWRPSPSRRGDHDDDAGRPSGLCSDDHGAATVVLRGSAAR